MSNEGCKMPSNNLRNNELEFYTNIWDSTWDGKDANGRPMAAGIYVIRLNTKNQSVVRKVVLY